MSEDAPTEKPRTAVLAIASNKGGVGKTTVASNLAIYVRALREDVPVLVVGLDDQHTLDRMFALGEPGPGDGNLKHAWAERSFDRVIQLGEYGVHFVRSPPDAVMLKARASDRRILRGIIERTAWPGLVILDAKSDLEDLTRNALHAADRIWIPVSDRAALEEAERLYRLLERDGIPPDRARVLFTLVDRRTRVDGSGTQMVETLERELRRRGWRRTETRLSRSPRVEALNSGGGKPLSILHHGGGTAVHREMRALADELIRDLRPGGAGSAEVRAAVRPAAAPAGGPLTLGRALLRGLGVR